MATVVIDTEFLSIKHPKENVIYAVAVLVGGEKVKRYLQKTETFLITLRDIHQTKSGTRAHQLTKIPPGQRSGGN